MNITKFVNVFVLDCGKNCFYLANSSNLSEVIQLTREEVLFLAKILPEGSLLVSEYSHLGCARKGLSLSQPFESHELMSLYHSLESAGITLRLFPQKSTPRAQKYAMAKGLFPDLNEKNLIKDTNKLLKKGEPAEMADKRDTISIRELIRDYPEISLMHPPETFDQNLVVKEAWGIKDTMNMILNYARRNKADAPSKHSSGYTIPAAEYVITHCPVDKVDQQCCAIVDFFLTNVDEIYNRLSPTARDVFGLHEKKGVLQISTNKAWKVNMTQIYSMIVSIMDHKGDAITRESTQHIAGWKYAKRFLFCLTPFHFRGGVARSNLMHHGAKNWIAKMSKLDDILLKKEGKTGKITSFVPRGEFSNDQDVVFAKYRKEYFNSVREFWQVCKELATDHKWDGKYAGYKESSMKYYGYK